MEISNQISEKSNHDTKELIERVLSIMSREKYGITEIETDRVKFDSANGGIIARHEHIRRFDSGEFKIEDHVNYRVVDLKFIHLDSLDIVLAYIMSALYITAVLCLDKLVFLIGVPFIGQAIYKYYNLKRIAKDILSEVVK